MRLAAAQVLYPLRHPRHREHGGPPDDQQRHKDNQQHLRDHVPYGFAPDALALRFDVTGVVKDRQRTTDRTILVQRQVIDMHRLAIEVKEPPEALVLPDMIKRNRRWCDPGL